MLSQKHIIDFEKINIPVAYASKSLVKAEHNYSTIYLKRLAVIWII